MQAIFVILYRSYTPLITIWLFGSPCMCLFVVEDWSGNWQVSIQPVAEPVSADQRSGWGTCADVAVWNVLRTLRGLHQTLVGEISLAVILNYLFVCLLLFYYQTRLPCKLWSAASECMHISK